MRAARRREPGHSPERCGEGRRDAVLRSARGCTQSFGEDRGGAGGGGGVAGGTAKAMQQAASAPSPFRPNPGLCSQGCGPAAGRKEGEREGAFTWL